MREIESQDLLDRFLEMHPKRIDLTLDRIQRLLKALGHPERQLPPTLHVAGTNGKGSVLAYLAAFFSKGGLSVHRYISPHLCHFHERIELNGTAISEAALVAIFKQCEAANQSAPITFFEITTAAAFLAFSQHKADILLLETGLGGRLDATNVLDETLVSCLTPISYDHQQFLGETLTEIATEKAAIIKENCPVVVSRQPPEAMAVIEAQAAAKNAPLWRQDQEWSVRTQAGQLIFETPNIRRILPSPALFGPHQFDNAGCALACIEAIHHHAAQRSPEKAFPEVSALRENGPVLMEGLQNTVWPGRLQRLEKAHPLQRVPEGWEIWLDGGHNPAAGKILSETACHKWKKRPLHLIIGMMAHKDIIGFLEPFQEFAQKQTLTITAVPIPDEHKAVAPGDLKQAAEDLGFSATMADTVPLALQALGDGPYGAAAKGRVLICGSLYLVGAVLKIQC